MIPKQLYLVLAAMLLLCLAPIPYGNFQLVRLGAMVMLWCLLPEWLILIPSWESHSSRIDNGIFCKQGLYVLRECVRRVDAVEPVGDVTKMRIGFVGWKQLFSVSHKRINKKWPALVRCIPCGREAVAGSIDCKGTSFIRGDQMFWRKSA